MRRESGSAARGYSYVRKAGRIGKQYRRVVSGSTDPGVRCIGGSRRRGDIHIRMPFVAAVLLRHSQPVSAESRSNPVTGARCLIHRTLASGKCLTLLSPCAMRLHLCIVTHQVVGRPRAARGRRRSRKGSRGPAGSASSQHRRAVREAKPACLRGRWRRAGLGSPSAALIARRLDHCRGPGATPPAVPRSPRRLRGAP
jgi:hypothetical protein